MVNSWKKEFLSLPITPNCFWNRTHCGDSGALSLKMGAVREMRPTAAPFQADGFPQGSYLFPDGLIVPDGLALADWYAVIGNPENMRAFRAVAVGHDGSGAGSGS